jgi:spermidine synthase
MTAPRITVRDEDGVRTLRVGAVPQSSMLLDDPFATDFDYPVYLHLTVAVVPEPRRALAIGLGGGTVVKQLWRDHPALRIDAVELDPEIAAVARESFALPDDERIRVTVGDGRAFLETAEPGYDVVIVDAFVEDRVPEALITEEFMRLARSRMSEHGVLAYNFHGSVAGDNSRPFRRFHRTLTNSFARVWTFPVGLADGPPTEHRELAILATDQRLPVDELLARIASRVDGRVSVAGFERLGEDLYSGPIRTGDVKPYLDPKPGRASRSR